MTNNTPSHCFKLFPPGSAFWSMLQPQTCLMNYLALWSKPHPRNTLNNILTQ